MMFDHALEGVVGGITKCTRHPVISLTSHAVTASSRHAEAKLFI
jgi:hypothetical protein